MTNIYLEAAPERALDMKAYAAQLTLYSFKVVSTWHKSQFTECEPGAVYPKAPAIHPELLKLAKADILLFFPGGAHYASWLKIGWAASCGLKIICVGGRGLPQDLQEFFVLRVETWEDLNRNHFLKLGSPHYKRPR